MNRRPTNLAGPVIAGLVLARCSCCREPQPLEPHPGLDPARRLCPGTRHVYLDRGDGFFDDTGTTLEAATADPPEADLLGDRPRQTDDKVRISLERATFAGGRS